MLDELKYQIIIYWDFNKKAYIAEVPELNGCMAKGDSYLTAAENIIKEMKKWTNRAYASSILAPQPIGRLPLRDELYCINCNRQVFSTDKWKRSKE